MTKHKELKSLVKSFFEDYLEQEEHSDYNDSIYHPIYITCSRVMMQEELGLLLDRMKELSND